MREQEAPGEDETVDVWARIGYSGYYTDVTVYYTTDGSERDQFCRNSLVFHHRQR